MSPGKLTFSKNTFIANTAAIFATSFSSPLTTSFIVPEAAGDETSQASDAPTWGYSAWGNEAHERERYNTEFNPDHGESWGRETGSKSGKTTSSGGGKGRSDDEDYKRGFEHGRENRYEHGKTSGGRPPTAPPSGKPPPGGAIVVPRAYKLTLWIVVALTVGAGLVHIVLAGIWPAPTEMQKRAFDDMAMAWTSGFGAIIGLIGGKALK